MRLFKKLELWEREYPPIRQYESYEINVRHNITVQRNARTLNCRESCLKLLYYQQKQASKVVLEKKSTSDIAGPKRVEEAERNL